MDMTAVAKKKRGRKLSDEVDNRIKITRKEMLRGIPYFLDNNRPRPDLISQPIDELVWVTLEREKEIVKNKQLLEVREIPVEEDSNSLGGSPVTTRMALPVQRVAKCLNNSFFQLLFAHHVQGTDANSPAFFTPEAYILMGKACEQFIIELSVRAYMVAVASGKPNMLTAADLVSAIRAAWRSSDTYSYNGSMDFLTDAIDRFTDDPCDGLDRLAKIHRKK